MTQFFNGNAYSDIKDNDIIIGEIAIKEPNTLRFGEVVFLVFDQLDNEYKIRIAHDKQKSIAL